jgi:hypothetical protein
MQPPPLTRFERDHLLRRARWLTEEGRQALAAGEPALANRIDEEAKQALRDYFDRLPVRAMAVCPHCAKPLLRSFDPFELDGPWWAPGQARPGPTPCAHFAVLRGAVDFRGVVPVGHPDGVHMGPQVPYVIPRLLGKDGVIAVIGELPMARHRAFTIAYFAKPRPPVAELTADWPDEVYQFTTEMGEPGLVYPVDPWDFDLAPWISAGKLRWCRKESENRLLEDEGAPAERCPYVGLEGVQAQLVVKPDCVQWRGLPDGAPVGMELD